MSLDILGALASAPQKSSGRCKIQTWLDNIDPDAPGLARLVIAVETSDPDADGFLPISQTLQVLRRLGLATSDVTLGQHRRRVCRCFD